MKKILCTISLMMLTLWLPAESFPKTGWIERADIAAAPEEAIAGGTYREAVGPTPKSLNYYLDNNVMSSQVFSLMYESLLSRDSRNLELTPNLACRWSISDDKLTYTFWIDPNARWSDGRPVTAEDVVWTYAVLSDPKSLTGAIRFALERFEPPVILPDGAVQFKARGVHWQNLATAGDLAILPKHALAAKDFNQLNFDFPVVSGPYRIDHFEEGRFLTMKRRSDWWRRGYPASKGIYNFETLQLCFFEDQQNSFDAFCKGELDSYAIYSAAQWNGIEQRVPAVRRNWIVKNAIYNRAPVGMQGFAMNLRRPLFKDLRVRQALACLLNREFMNKHLMHSQYFLHRSYWEDLYDDAHPNPNPPFAFNPEKARGLLTEAGWMNDPKTGLLMKNGRKFEFSFLNRGGTDKYLAVYSEALKKVGITMTIVNKDWSAWAKDMDEFNFDMTWAAWGGGLFKDPEQMWSSREANRKGSANITGFAHQAVDALIEKQRTVFDIDERNQILRQIDAILYAEMPYILLWNINYTRLLRWNRFGTPEGVVGKYGGESGIAYWWLDEELEEQLKDAMKQQSPMPPEPAEIRKFK